MRRPIRTKEWEEYCADLKASQHLAVCPFRLSTAQPVTFAVT